MKKFRSLVIQLLVCVIFPFNSKADGTCEMCGYQFEGDDCPFKVQHQFIYNTLDELVGEESGTDVIGTTISNGGDGLSAIGSAITDLLPAVTIITDFTQHKPLTFSSGDGVSFQFKDQQVLKARCNHLHGIANQKPPGSAAWRGAWQKAFYFANQHRYNQHCLYAAVIAQTKLQNYLFALSLLNECRTIAINAGDIEFLHHVHAQAGFIYLYMNEYENSVNEFIAAFPDNSVVVGVTMQVISAIRNYLKLDMPEHCKSRVVSWHRSLVFKK